MVMLTVEYVNRYFLWFSQIDIIIYFNSSFSHIGAHRSQWRDRKMLGVDDLASLENLTEVFTT